MWYDTHVSLVAAIANDNVIGCRGSMPWDLPEDLQRFKRLTEGHPIVMGKSTHESIGKVLPNRHNIILTHDTEWKGPEEATVVFSFKQALDVAAEKTEEIFVIGGGEVYKQAMPYADTLYVTRIYADFPGDTYFPSYDDFPYVIEREPHQTSEFEYEFLTLEK